MIGKENWFLLNLYSLAFYCNPLFVTFHYTPSENIFSSFHLILWILLLVPWKSDHYFSCFCYKDYFVYMNFEPTESCKLLFSGGTWVSHAQIVLLAMFKITAEHIILWMHVSWYQYINLQLDQIYFNMNTGSFCLKD